MPDVPGGDRGHDVRRIPRPSEPVAPRGQRRETRKPVAPRESQPQQPRSIERPNPKSKQLQPGNEARNGGGVRGNGAQARQQKPPRPQPQPPKQRGGNDNEKEHGGKQKP
jgi:hypothetical protein